MNALSEYNLLSDSEIGVLTSNGCTSDNWANISVKKGFDPRRCRNVSFSGNIRLGTSGKSFTDESGVLITAGITNAQIHNCTIGDNVSIYNIRDYLANYAIDDNVVIRNCGRISTEGKTAFGNGTPVAVMSEAGARSVKIWDKLSSHQAYIVAMYKYKTVVNNVIDLMTAEYVSLVSSETGKISQNSVIHNCNSIRNVNIGACSRIDGAIRLNDGSVNSCKEDPVFIGPGVIMDHFIVCSGSTVSDSALIDKCFIGQGCTLSKHFSAENSLFFANCGGFLGEATSIFAGPYTISHHKSTLLIAGMFSFMNAGSGSNQSNHMYKLGPVHQGIVERGSKTTSDSYLLWPSHIGPFTVVMGRHEKNIDTSNLPFSYLIENNKESILVPGINLKSVGTIRDAQKWLLRDRRRDPLKMDHINFSLLNPYTVKKMVDGRALLLKIRNESGSGMESYSYNNMKITGDSLERGIHLYHKGIEKYIGNSLIKRIEASAILSNKVLADLLKPVTEKGSGEWIDMSGLIVPKNEVEKLLAEVENGEILSLHQLSSAFTVLNESTVEWEWTWALSLIEQETGIKIDALTAADLIRLIEKWKKSVVDLDNLIFEDARKEFNSSSMTGFGIDGNDDDKLLDFGQVRGNFESNEVVNSIREHIRIKVSLGDTMIEKLSRIKQN